MGVSQALLSHYEKGIRECGLDFVVKIADYYHVSCDYILGRTADRNGIPPQVSVAEETVPPRTNAVLSMNRKLVSNSLDIIFGLLEQTGSKGLNAEVTSYLMVSVYKMVRMLYSVNPKNPQAMFSIMPEVYAGLSTALQSIAETNARCVCLGKDAEGVVVHAPALSPDVISRHYPESAPSLYHLIQKTEEKMKKLQ